MDPNQIVNASGQQLRALYSARQQQLASTGGDAFNAVDGLLAFKLAQESGNKVFREPMSTRIDLVGYADATGLITPREFGFFAVGLNATGQGFTRALTEADTTLEGSGGQMIGGNSFVADRVGFGVNVDLPRPIKHILVEHAFLRHERMSHRWKMGPTSRFPMNEFGLAAEATTAAGVDYSTNGAIASKQLPPQGRLFFPAKQQISFTVTTIKPIYVTEDGLTAVSGTNALLAADYSAFMYVTADGWRFEHAAVG
jgi:hypothetical protein